MRQAPVLSMAVNKPVGTARLTENHPAVGLEGLGVGIRWRRDRCNHASGSDPSSVLFSPRDIHVSQ